MPRVVDLHEAAHAVRLEPRAAPAPVLGPHPAETRAERAERVAVVLHDDVPARLLARVAPATAPDRRVALRGRLELEVHLAPEGADEVRVVRALVVGDEAAHVGVGREDCGAHRNRQLVLERVAKHREAPVRRDVAQARAARALVGPIARVLEHEAHRVIHAMLVCWEGYTHRRGYWSLGKRVPLHILMHETSNNQMPGHQPSVDKVKTAYAIAPMTVGALVLYGGAMGMGRNIFDVGGTLGSSIATGVVGGVGAMAMYNLGVTGALGESDSGPNTGTFMLGATAATGSMLAARAATTALAIVL